MDSTFENYLALGLYALGTVVVVVFLLLFSYFLGPRQTAKRAGDEPFESGVVPVGTARVRLSAKFYLIALFFVIFDLEVAYLFGWAVAVREVGWIGFIEAAIFILILLAGLAYLWRLGALDWVPKERYRRKQAGPARRIEP